MSDADPIATAPRPYAGRGLVLFPPGTSAGSRRRRVVFVAVCLALALAVTWPVFPAAMRVFPGLVGLPAPFAWVVGVLVVGFAALVALYRGDLADRRAAGRPPEGR
jgi:hypothetical protein